MEQAAMKTDRKRGRQGVQAPGRTRTMVQIAMLSAVAAVLMLWDFPLPIAPSFYKLDFSEVPVLIGSFAMGPLAGAGIELIKILINLVVNGTDTMFVGELANLLIGCALVVPAGLIYRKHKTRRHAIFGMLTGIVCMTVVGAAVNAFMLLPAYGAAFGMNVSAFVGMGQAIIPAVDSLFKFCLLIVAPFNLLKGVVVSVITLLLYKHISRLLKSR
jgi:riboflavin transporter FmnP